jgi:hypothetical protein
LANTGVLESRAVGGVDDDSKLVAPVHDLHPVHAEARVLAFGTSHAHVVHAVVGEHQYPQPLLVSFVHVVDVAGQPEHRLAIAAHGDDAVRLGLANLGRRGNHS